jgi:hypothetical protein
LLLLLLLLLLLPDDDRLAARRQRGALRLLPELLAAGVLTDAAGLLGVMKSLVRICFFSVIIFLNSCASLLWPSCWRLAC